MVGHFPRGRAASAKTMEEVWDLVLRKGLGDEVKILYLGTESVRGWRFSKLTGVSTLALNFLLSFLIFSREEFCVQCRSGQELKEGLQPERTVEGWIRDPKTNT